jgi:RHS repeat-associated protein
MLTGGVITTYTCDAANQLNSSQDNTGTTNFSYDANGNQALQIAVGGGRTTNTWDYETRLTKVILPGGTRNTFVYDADSKRVLKQDSTGTTKLIWDLLSTLEETDGNDATQVVYTHGPTGYGGLFSRFRLGAPQFYLFDALGSVDRLTDNSGTVTDQYFYQAFGIIKNTVGISSNPFRFVGRAGYYYDSDLSQHYVRTRFYNPGSGRFLTIDPVGFASGDTGLYVYVGNNCVNQIDPSGTCRGRGCGFWRPGFRPFGCRPSCFPAPGLFCPRPSPTWLFSNRFGAWHISQQKKEGDEPGWYHSKTIIIFHPNAQSVCCQEIAFVQSAQLLDADGKPQYSSSRERIRATPDGWAIDQLRGIEHGWYTYGKKYAPSPRSGSPGAAPVPYSDAVLKDEPGWHEAPAKFSFESCAICRIGRDRNLVYGCLSWGFQVNETQDMCFSENHFADKPSKTFMDAVAGWNKQAAGPIEQQNVTGGGQVPLPDFR